MPRQLNADSEKIRWSARPGGLAALLIRSGTQHRRSEWLPLLGDRRRGDTQIGQYGVVQFGRGPMSVPRIAAVLSISLFLVSCSNSGPVRAVTSGTPSASSNSTSDNAPSSGWRRIALPATPGGYAEGAAVSCTSDQDCLVGGIYAGNGRQDNGQLSILQSTTNAGRTWTTRTRFPSWLEGGIESAACDQRYCFIAAENAAATAQTLARTSDEGRTWTAVPYPSTWAKASITGYMIACSASRCLTYGNNTLAEDPANPSALKYQTGFAATTNDGQSWTEITLPGATQIDQIACVWSGQCWAEYETSADELEHVATTLDAGFVWTPLGAISPSEVGGNTFALDPDHQVGFTCENAKTCFILDNSNDLLTSRDGGRRWNISQGPSPGSTDAMTCTPPSSTCWIVSVDLPRVWIGRPS
jgi:hypothetical protein